MGIESNIHISVEFETEGLNVRQVHGLKLQQYYDWHHQFEIRFPIELVEGANEITLNQAQNYAGKPITIQIKSQDGSHIYNVFRGIIIEVSLTRHSGSASDLLFKGYSPTILLDDGPHCHGFLEKSLSSVIGSVLQRYPRNLIPSTVSLAKDPQLSYVLQYNESAFNFINRLSNDFGQWCYYDGKDLIFGQLQSSDPIVLSFGHGLSNFQTSMSVTPLSFEGSVYNIGDKEVFAKVDSDSFNVAGVDVLGKRAITESMNAYPLKQLVSLGQSASDLSSLNEMASARKSALAGELIIVSGSSDNPSLKVGSRINIQGGRIGTFGSDTVDYGSYTVIKVSHFADGRGTYTNSFEAIPSALQVPPYTTTAKMPQCEAQIARVADNRDPEKLGRVKVQFLWQKDGSTTNWIRVKTLHAGTGYGTYWLPEIDDIVKIEFPGNNPSFPIVGGSLFYQDQADRYNDNNDIKVIRTKSGNEIQFCDTEGEEAIHIFNKDKANEILITMKNDGQIKIKSKNNITISAAGNLNMSATNINMRASKDMTIEVKEIFRQKVDKDYIMTVMENADILVNKNLTEAVMEDHSLTVVGNSTSQSVGDMKLKGMNFEAEGNLNGTVKAGAQLELSGGAQAKLNATMVMIN